MPFPHEYIVDTGGPLAFYGFSCLSRQDGSGNGRIRGYRFYCSEDGISWGNPVAEGNFANSATLKRIVFASQVNRTPVIASSPLAFSIIENFAIGEIRVAGLIDFEARPIYHLQVIATDNGSPSFSTSKVYPITVGNVIETNTEAVTIGLTSSGKIYEGHGNPALTGFSADPDGDGVANAIEILLGTDPSRANAQPPIRPVTFTEGGQTWLAYEYDLAADSGLAMRCTGSEDVKI